MSVRGWIWDSHIKTVYRSGSQQAAHSEAMIRNTLMKELFINLNTRLEKSIRNDDAFSDQVKLEALTTVMFKRKGKCCYLKMGKTHSRATKRNIALHQRNTVICQTISWLGKSQGNKYPDSLLQLSEVFNGKMCSKIQRILKPSSSEAREKWRMKLEMQK